MTDRFTIARAPDHGAKPVWYVIDTDTNRHQGGPYRLKRDADRMADRWNADHDLAEAESPYPPDA